MITFTEEPDIKRIVRAVFTDSLRIGGSKIVSDSDIEIISESILPTDTFYKLELDGVFIGFCVANSSGMNKVVLRQFSDVGTNQVKEEFNKIIYHELQ